MRDMDKITKYLSEIGRKGGSATGKRKARSRAHYVEMARKSAESRRKNKLKKTIDKHKPLA